MNTNLWLQLWLHVLGDYVTQSHWMANEKTKRFSVATIHAGVYTLPFIFLLHPSIAAVAVIYGTHAVIDRWRLAKYIVFLKNTLLSPWEWDPRTSWAGTVKMNMDDGSTEVMVEGCRATGFPADTPPYACIVVPMRLNMKSSKQIQPYLQPKDITKPPYVFGKHEVEDAAIKLLEFFVIEKRGEWQPFTFFELHIFYNARRYNPNEMLFGLMGPWYDDGGIGSMREGNAYVIHLGQALEMSNSFKVRVSSRTYEAQGRSTR